MTSPIPHPNDGRVYGGPLSYPMLGEPWSAPQSDDRVPFGSDVSTQVVVVEPNYQPNSNWVASILIGELQAGDGFYTPRQGSQIVVKCILGKFYGDNPVTSDVKVNQATTIDGHDGWLVESQLSFDIQGLTDQGRAADRGDRLGGRPSGLYYASIPDTTPELVPTARQVLQELKVAGLTVRSRPVERTGTPDGVDAAGSAESARPRWAFIASTRRAAVVTTGSKACVVGRPLADRIGHCRRPDRIADDDQVPAGRRKRIARLPGARSRVPGCGQIVGDHHAAEPQVMPDHAPDHRRGVRGPGVWVDLGVVGRRDHHHVDAARPRPARNPARSASCRVVRESTTLVTRSVLPRTAPRPGKCLTGGGDPRRGPSPRRTRPAWPATTAGSELKLRRSTPIGWFTSVIDAGYDVGHRSQVRVDPGGTQLVAPTVSALVRQLGRRTRCPGSAPTGCRRTLDPSAVARCRPPDRRRAASGSQPGAGSASRTSSASRLRHRPRRRWCCRARSRCPLGCWTGSVPSTCVRARCSAHRP